MTTDDPVRHRYQIIPPYDASPSIRPDNWDVYDYPGDGQLPGSFEYRAELQDNLSYYEEGLNVEYVRKRTDTVTALIQHLYKMKQVSHSYNSKGEFYDVRIYSDGAAHQEFLVWYNRVLLLKCPGVQLVKARV